MVDPMDSLAMETAHKMARENGNCSRLQVGALIVDIASGKAMGAGWNCTLDENISHQHNDDSPCTVAVHAEILALVSVMAWWPSLPAIMFVTHAPCVVCAQAIALSGFIEEVVFDQEFRDMSGVKVLGNLGVAVRRLG